MRGKNRASPGFATSCHRTTTGRCPGRACVAALVRRGSACMPGVTTLGGTVTEGSSLFSCAATSVGDVETHPHSAPPARDAGQVHATRLGFLADNARSARPRSAPSAAWPEFWIAWLRSWNLVCVAAISSRNACSRVSSCASVRVERSAAICAAAPPGFLPARPLRPWPRSCCRWRITACTPCAAVDFCITSGTLEHADDGNRRRHAFRQSGQLRNSRSLSLRRWSGCRCRSGLRGRSGRLALARRNEIAGRRLRESGRRHGKRRNSDNHRRQAGVNFHLEPRTKRNAELLGLITLLLHDRVSQRQIDKPERRVP